MKINLNLAQIEANLDLGLVKARMGNGRLWALRRNGATKLWKTRPTEFRIPVKAGLRACGYIDHDSTFGVAGDPDVSFIVTATAATTEV